MDSKFYCSIILTTEKLDTSKKLFLKFTKHYFSGIDISEEKFKVYWKDETKYNCTFVVTLRDSSYESQVTNFLLLLKNVCNSWQIIFNYSDSPNEPLVTSAICSNPKINGIFWINIEAQ
jgi:hypothetical protein